MPPVSTTTQTGAVTEAPVSREALAVAEEIRAHMARRRLSQVYTAAQLGISTSSMSRRLQGESEFTVSELYRLAEIFGIPASKLLKDAEAGA